jgi:glycosyltransferase involved in cell wall biosynthesis
MKCMTRRLDDHRLDEPRQRTLDLSLVIPVYNEADYIGACLDHVVPQLDDLREVIVVDNVCTDGTMAVVQGYVDKYPKIRVVRENRKGLIHARNAGFAAASGQVYGRIDADSRIVPTWTRVVLDTFAADTTGVLGGLTGLSAPYDSPFDRSKKLLIDVLVRLKLAGNDMKIANMHGANMAVLADAWSKIADKTSERSDIHEDIDVALSLVGAGFKIRQSTNMWADVSPRRALTPPREYTTIVRSGVSSFELHGRSSWSLRYLVAPVTWLSHAVFWLPYRAFDPVRRRFSLRRMIRNVDYRPACVFDEDTQRPTA